MFTGSNSLDLLFVVGLAGRPKQHETREGCYSLGRGEGRWFRVMKAAKQ